MKMTNITIPPAALERGTEVVRAWRRAGVKSENIARAAFLAIVESWEGAKTIRDDGRRQTYAIPAIILPLPAEDSDE